MKQEICLMIQIIRRYLYQSKGPSFMLLIENSRAKIDESIVS